MTEAARSPSDPAVKWDITSGTLVSFNVRFVISYTAKYKVVPGTMFITVRKKKGWLGTFNSYLSQSLPGLRLRIDLSSHLLVLISFYKLESYLCTFVLCYVVDLVILFWLCPHWFGTIMNCTLIFFIFFYLCIIKSAVEPPIPPATHAYR